MTRDQSYVQVLLDAGLIKEQDAAHSAFSSIILQSMGQKEDVQVALGRLELRRGDRLLICSDGVTGHLNDTDLAEILKSRDSVDIITQRLVDLQHINTRGLPSRLQAERFLDETLDLVFPQMVGNTEPCTADDMRCNLERAMGLLCELLSTLPDFDPARAQALTRCFFFDKLPAIAERLWKDAQAIYDGDPAARSLTEGQVRSFMAEGFTPAAPITVTDAATATVKVHLTASQRDLEIPTNLSILDALEAQGIRPKVGCRMGVCHTCVCTRAEGTTLDMQTGEQDAQPGMDVRICMSRARTDLTLDL